MSGYYHVAFLFIAWVLMAQARMSYTGMMPHGADVPGVVAIGHVNVKGGGERNAFGEAFAKNNYEWDAALCLADSDGDGDTNGMELGDPCCMWRIGEMRELPLNPGTQLSHPSDNSWTSGIDFDFSDFRAKNSIEAFLKKLEAAGGNGARRDMFVHMGFPCQEFVEEEMVSSTLSNLFESFYSSQGGGRIGLMVVNIGSYLFLLSRPNGGLLDVGRKFATLHTGIVIFLSLMFTEVESGLLHLTADNPAFNDVPLFGSLARGFQAHHDDPSGIAQMGWIDFLTKVDAGVVLLLIFGVIVQCKTRSMGYHAGAWYTTAFCWMTVPSLYLMMATHRWTHCPPQDVPRIVALLQDSGVFMSIDHHNVHQCVSPVTPVPTSTNPSCISEMACFSSNQRTVYCAALGSTPRSLFVNLTLTRIFT